MDSQRENRLKTMLGIENLKSLVEALRQIKQLKETGHRAHKRLTELGQENNAPDMGLSCAEAGRLGGIINQTKNGIASLQSAGKEGQRA